MKGRFIAVRVGVFCLAVMVAAFVSVTRVEAEGSASGQGDKEIPMKAVPNAVRMAAEKAIAGGSVKRVVLEKEEGRVAYNVEATTGGKTMEFTFASDGTLMAQEEYVDFAQLPAEVRAAAEKYFGDGRGLRASKVIAKNVTSYEVEGKKGGKNVSVTFSAAGALLEEEGDED
jgi:uncharacterized membrane protein YkoI